MIGFESILRCRSSRQMNGKLQVCRVNHYTVWPQQGVVLPEQEEQQIPGISPAQCILCDE